MRLFHFTILNVALLLTATIGNAQTNMSHPSWILNGNIYEVNVRQYTPEGTFKAFQKHLPRLKKMGVQTLWFMPINPISKKDRKGTLGSYYAVSNYEAINPEYGTMADWNETVAKAHALGMKVIVDWVPNHTGADHYWLQAHPDFYKKDSAGNFAIPHDWTDTRKLNYLNPELVDTMIAQMKFWITTSGIDGFRCDVASDVPDAFWKKCISELHKTKNVFMLAEGEKPELNEDGFDATYFWSVFNVLKKVVKKELNANSVDSAIHCFDTAGYPKGSLHMYFTSDHDENSWSKADYETMPGKTHAPFAVLTFTMKNSVPLIYSGQEEPFLRAISFFEKDTITFSKFQRADFYKKLLALKKYNPALSPGASFKRIKTTDDKDIYAYIRYTDKHFVFVLLNLSDTKQSIRLKDKLPATVVVGDTLFNAMNGTIVKNNLSSGITLAPWDYMVLTDNDATIESKIGLKK